MNDTTHKEADLLKTAASSLNWVDGDNPLEMKQMYATVALASTTCRSQSLRTGVTNWQPLQACRPGRFRTKAGYRDASSPM